jgi:urease accessory protein UreH
MREDFVLTPSEKDLASAVRMFEYSYTVSLCAIQEGLPAAFWRALEDRLNGIAWARTRPGQAVWGVSSLVSDGIVVRGLSMSGRFIYEALIEFWRTARVAITGQDAVPPRKVY